jgi:hypothetical protein
MLIIFSPAAAMSNNRHDHGERQNKNQESPESQRKEEIRQVGNREVAPM